MAKQAKTHPAPRGAYCSRYICTLPKRGVERSERADHYGIRYKPIERLWNPLVRELLMTDRREEVARRPNGDRHEERIGVIAEPAGKARGNRRHH